PERRFPIEETPFVQWETVFLLAVSPQRPSLLEAGVRGVEAVADAEGVRAVEGRVPFEPEAAAVRARHEGDGDQGEIGQGERLRRRVGSGALALVGQALDEGPGLVVLCVADVRAALLPGREPAKALAPLVRLPPVFGEAPLPRLAEEDRIDLLRHV